MIIMKYYVANFIIQDSDTIDKQTVCDLLCATLGEIGFESFEEIQEGVNAYIQEDLYNRETLRQAVEEFDIPQAIDSYDIKKVEDKDWNETWENEGFAPIQIGELCVIYDANHPIPDDLHPQINVGIDAKLAFGTGNHETTRMVISHLFNLDLKDKRLLDCGCGTGILGIVASKLGAKEIVGYDIDEWSVENTKHNAEINHVNNIEVFHGDSSVLSHINGVFDVVVANINRNILFADLRHFRDVMALQAMLILSGFYEEDIPILLEAAKTQNLTCIHQTTENKWACLVLST
jgi:ribosomal protein L11 methyltransferase